MTYGSAGTIHGSAGMIYGLAGAEVRSGQKLEQGLVSKSDKCVER